MQTVSLPLLPKQLSTSSVFGAQCPMASILSLRAAASKHKAGTVTYHLNIV